MGRKLVSVQPTITSVWLSEQPFDSGVEPIMLKTTEFERKFNFKFDESIFVSEKFKHNFGHEERFKEEWELIESYLKNPIHDKLVICFIDDQVGYGLFARKDIEMSEVIGIYSGEVVKRKDQRDMNRYGMGIDQKYGIDSSDVGGITRFIQHMPYLPHRVDPSMSLKNMDDTEFMRSFALSNQINQDEIACANAIPKSIIYDNKPIIYIVAGRSISKGEQIGITYSKNYWLVRGSTPKYFFLNGRVINPDIERRKESLRAKYQLHDKTLPELERGLRKAVANHFPSDIALFLETGVNVNSSNKDGKTALHFAKDKQCQECINILLEKGAKMT